MNEALTLNPAALVRTRFRRWWEARLPRTDSQLLTQGNVYILPTRAGWMTWPGWHGVRGAVTSSSPLLRCVRSAT